MLEYFDLEDRTYYMSALKLKNCWIEIPKGTEIITGSASDKYSIVFWKPSLGEVWRNGRFAKYEAQDCMTYEEYIRNWNSDPVLWVRSNGGFDE